MCGYSRSKGSLSFHHVDPEVKEYGISRMFSHVRGWEKIERELDKCVLLCLNCHGEVHEGITTIPEEVIQRWLGPQGNPNSNRPATCPDCGKAIKVTSKRCAGCARKAKTKYPGRRQLKKDLNTIGPEGTAKKYDVTRAAVRNWIKKGV